MRAVKKFQLKTGHHPDDWWAIVTSEEYDSATEEDKDAVWDTMVECLNDCHDLYVEECRQDC